jgi:ribonuclease E
VNSGRATREHHIEDTALKTNLEAAEEIARQLRLRDLAGLIVIDFIDMDEKRNNRAVERRLKECLRHDRARIQVGHISHFGLLEMSRQRIRSSVLESSTEKCPHCGGTGHVRSVSSVALQLLRSLEEMLLKGATHNLTVRTRSDIALYLLNHKRAHLRALEERFRIAIMVNADATIAGQLSFVIEKGEQVHSLEQAKALALQPASAVPIQEEEEEDYEDEEEPDTEDAEANASEEETQPAGEPGPGRRRRRRRRGRRGGEDRAAFQQERQEFPQEGTADFAPATGEHDVGGSEEPHEAAAVGGLEQPAESHGEGERRRRRRGRRGGRRNRRGREGESFARNAAVEPELGQPDFEQASGAEATSPTAPFGEPEPRAIPVSEAHSDMEAHSDVPAAPNAEPQAAPSPQVAEPDVSEPPAAEAPRRRSTVREPAPQALREDESSPAPSFTPPAPSIEPVVSNSEESESGDRPRRSGWWSKRVFGKS